MNPTTHSALLGGSFALATVILFVAFFHFILPRLRSQYLITFSVCALVFLCGPFAIIQLKDVLFQAEITDPGTRDVGFHIHIAALIASGIFALIRLLKLSKRNRDADQTKI